MITRVLKLVLSVIYLPFTLILSLLARVSGTQNRASVILTYHGVEDRHRDRFLKHMKVLRRFVRPVHCDGAHGGGGRGRTAAVSFDDGFADFQRNALPILISLGIPATVFVTTGYMGCDPGWIKMENRAESAGPLLAGEDLIRLPPELITVGSHGVTHRRLSELDDDSLKLEMAESKETLGQILNREIDLLSLPYGDVDDRVLEFVKKSGYRKVYHNVPVSHLSRYRGFFVGRINVSLEDWMVEYRLKLLGAYQWLPAAMAVKMIVLGKKWNGGF